MLKYLDFKSKKKYLKEVIIPAMINNGFDKRAYKMLYCGSWSKVAICDDCGTGHFAGAVSCKDKFCPVCQKKRSILYLTKTMPICEDIISHGFQIMMFTFTIRTLKEMSAKFCLDWLYDSFRYMTHEYKTSANWFKTNILGGVRSLELKVGEDKITKDSTGLWHPHFHVLVCVKKGLILKGGEFHKLLRSYWNKALKHFHDYDVNGLGTVNIKTLNIHDKNSMIDNLQECFKYITKYEWNDDHVHELVESLDGVRSLSTFGNFRYYLHEQEIERDMNKNYLEVAKHFCAVCGGSEFSIFDYPTDNNMQLMDLQSYSRYQDIDDSDEILNDYKNTEG